MKLSIVFVILIASPALCLAEVIKHSHAGREHAHALPSEGIKHSHNQGPAGVKVPPEEKIVQPNPATEEKRRTIFDVDPIDMENINSMMM